MVLEKNARLQIHTVICSNQYAALDTVYRMDNFIIKISW